MSTEVGTAYVSLVPSAKGFAAKMQSEIGGDVTRAGTVGGESYGRGFTSTASRGIGSRAKSLFGGLARAGIAAAAVTGVVVGKVLYDSIQEASNLDEVVAKSGQIFGQKALPELQRFAKGAATAIGQSRLQALNAASTFAVFGKSAGLSGKNLVGFSTDFTALASDLASFNNTTPQEAIDAIGAALRGEAEPLRRYGVLLDDASLRNEALRQGLIKTTKEALTPQQKVLAAQALIYKQTSDAQGDFKRTSGGLANQQRILGANFSNLKGILGQGLTPALTGVVKVLNNDLMPPIIKLAREHAPELGRAFGAWVQDIDFSGMIAGAKSFANDIDWGNLGTDIRELGAGLRDVDVSGGTNDGLKVFGVLVGYAADHTDELTKALPYLVAALVAYKGAQLLNNTIGRNSLIGFALQTTATFTQAAANRQLAVTLREVNAAQGGAVTGMTRLQTATSKYGNVARTVAGAAGLGLMAHGATQSSKAVGTLEATLGGAALGFSVGGPWGAAIGGIGGFATGLLTAGDNAESLGNKAKTTVPKIESMRDAINEVTGAIERQTHTVALDRLRTQLTELIDLDVGESNFGDLQRRFGSLASVIEDLPDGSSLEDLSSMFGFTARDVVRASLGMKGAIDRVRGGLRATPKDTMEAAAAFRFFKHIIPGVTKELRRNQAAVRDDARATQSWGKLLGSVREKVRKPIITRFKNNALWNAKEVAQLQKRYALTPGEVRTVLRAIGTDISMAEVRAYTRQLDDTGKKRPTPKIDADPAPGYAAMNGFTREFHKLNGDRVDTYIYTHHVDTYETRGDPGPDRTPTAPRMTPRAAPTRVRTADTSRRRVALILSDGTELDGYLDERIASAGDLVAEARRAQREGTYL